MLFKYIHKNQHFRLENNFGDIEFFFKASSEFQRQYTNN